MGQIRKFNLSSSKFNAGNKNYSYNQSTSKYDLFSIGKGLIPSETNYNGGTKKNNLFSSNYSVGESFKSVFDGINIFDTDSNTSGAQNTQTNYGSGSGAGEVASTKGIYLSNKKAANGYGKPFLDKVKQIAAKYGMDYTELLAMMNMESGVSAKAVTGSYVGLIQSGDEACATVGYTKSQVYNMSPMEQLDFVDKRIAYVQKNVYGGRQISVTDFYCANFLPARVKNEVLTRKGDHDYRSKKTGNWRSYYDDNAAVDINKDNAITKSEMKQWINRKKVDESSFSG